MLSAIHNVSILQEHNMNFLQPLVKWSLNTTVDIIHITEIIYVSAKYH